MQVRSVCELFADTRSFNGARVQVKARYWYGLTDNCGAKFRIGKREFPTVIDLVHSNFYREDPEIQKHPTMYATYDAFERTLLQQARSGRRAELWVTARGTFRSLHIDHDGKLLGAFGHLGSMPAEFIVEEILETTVVDKPTHDYSVFLRRHPITN